jgi:phosphoglycerol transferase MdoB-like AlkP superfamily enzyme
MVLVLELLFKFLALPDAGGLMEGHLWLNIGITTLFTLPLIVFLTVLDGMLPRHEIRKVVGFIGVVLTSVFLFQLVFLRIFDVPFSLSSVVMADAVTEFWGSLLEALLKNWWRIGVMLLPLLGLLISFRWLPHKQLRRKSVIIGSLTTIGMFVVAVNSLWLWSGQINGPFHTYFQSNNILMTFEQFGVLTATRVDVQRAITGFEERAPKVDEPTLEVEEGEQDWTGYFKEKNLIFIVAESYNTIAVSRELTPTLYQLTNEGFVFNNFYSPLFLSTIGGEMQALTGLLPNQSMIAQWQGGNAPTFPYAIGFSFAGQGYEVQSYHNWSDWYYARRITRPTLGFLGEGAWIGCGSGMEKLMNCNQWPSSDLEMIKGVGNKFIGQSEPQATYILTVSGHSPYNFYGNAMARKNQAAVEHLPYSTGPRAYLAAQLELEKMLTDLLLQLRAAGELDNTVIALVGDHYPYALDLEEINELSTYPRDTLFEVHHSNFILWTADMPTVEIDKVGSQIDVLPTLLSLFDIPYDPNLMAGRNILDPTREGLAIFSNRSWISDRAIYNASTRRWTARGDAEVTQEYINQMNAVVAGRFVLSEQMFRRGY